MKTHQVAQQHREGLARSGRDPYRPHSNLGPPVHVNWLAGVSFAQTPLDQIGAKIEAIVSRGWHEEERGDPWVVSFSKSLPEGDRDPEAELREVMGEYWLDADAIRELLSARGAA
jgi:hypothetical protein